MNYTVISMFSGAGGLDMGFHNQGFHILWANDFFKDACDTYDHWANYNPDGSHKAPDESTIIECGDISKIDLSKVCPSQDIDVVIGGFPCQGFSLAGPRQVDDSRNVLYRHFVEMVRLKNPKVLVAENVIGIKTLGDGAVFEKIIDDFSSLGYTMSAPTVNAKDYGVPQDRMRVIFFGVRNDICDKKAFVITPPTCKKVTIKDALSPLPPVVSSEVCQASFSSRYMSRNRKRDYDQVSFTIPAMAKQVPLSPDSSGMHYVDVDLFEFNPGDNRRLSYKEAAAIQTFPVGMKFFGDLDSKYKQIGNAVPVRLAEHVAGEVKKILSNTTDPVRNWNSDDPDDEIYGTTADKRPTKQVTNGKAFEFYTIKALYDELRTQGWPSEQLSIEDNTPAYKALENAAAEATDYLVNTDDEAEAHLIENPISDFESAARRAAKYICDSEPIFKSPHGLIATLQAMPDSAGQKGDVRDITIRISRKNALNIRELGISCKNNHEAVKHPRITENLDFAKDWTKGEFHCSSTFLSEMAKIQDKIVEYSNQYSAWKDIPNKHEEIYFPIVNLFVSEIKRLGIVGKNASEQEKKDATKFARLLFEYMFGTQDFYKVIKDDVTRSTKVFPYNMHDTLMKGYNGIKPPHPSSCIAFPSEIVEVRIKPSSKTTLEIYFDSWILSLRLHNADKKKKKTALKFDVQIKAQPKKIIPVQIFW